MPDLRFEAEKAKKEALYWEDRARDLRTRLEQAENMAADWRRQEKIYLNSAKALDARPFPEKVRKALEATSVSNVRVKPLEWQPQLVGFRAHSIIGTYLVIHNGYWWRHESLVEGAASSVEQAKKAAQADYEARILSAIEVEP